MSEIITDPADWPAWAENFAPNEFTCSHTGKLKVSDALLFALQTIRGKYGHQMRITSGYRDPTHPIEAAKAAPGAHAAGVAADIACNGQRAFQIIRLAMACCADETLGIGVSQRGDRARFVHIDVGWERRSHSTMWSY